MMLEIRSNIDQQINAVFTSKLTDGSMDRTFKIL